MAKRSYISTTLRSLWLRSGNQCAHPACHRALLNDSGIFVGDIAHIEGLNPKSARYNPNMNDAERNAPENLMLMCPTHHREVDISSKHTAVELLKWKNDHEKKYSDIANIFQGMISDYTAEIQISYPKNLRRLVPGLSVEQEKENVEIFCEMLDKLQPVPNATKSFLAIAVSRARKKSFRTFAADLHEICSVGTLSPREANQHKNILETHKLAYYDDGEPGQDLLALIPDHHSGWNIWEDIQNYFKKNPNEITKLLVDMDFTVLDE